MMHIRINRTLMYNLVIEIWLCKSFCNDIVHLLNWKFNYYYDVIALVYKKFETINNKPHIKNLWVDIMNNYYKWRTMISLQI